MTKKDYIRAAELVRTSGESAKVRARMVDTFVRFFRPDNPRFNVDRFLAACEVSK